MSAIKPLIIRCISVPRWSRVCTKEEAKMIEETLEHISLISLLKRDLCVALVNKEIEYVSL